MKTIPGVGLQGQGLALQEAVNMGFAYFQLLEPEGVAGGDLEWLVDNVPGAVIDLRCYSSNRMSQDPVEAAYADADRIVGSVTARQRAKPGLRAPGRRAKPRLLEDH